MGRIGKANLQGLSPPATCSQQWYTICADWHMLYTYQAGALPLKPYILATSLANPIRLNEHDVECCFRLSASAQPWRLHQLHPGQQHWSCFRSSMAHLGTAQQPGAYFSCPYMPIPYIVPIRSDKYSLGILLFTTVLKTPNPYPQATVPGRMSACDRLPLWSAFAFAAISCIDS